MQKVKHDFQLANKETSSVNVYMIQNCFTLFSRNSCLMFKLSTACSTLKKSVLIQTQSQSLTHAEHLKFELRRRYLVLNEEERKQENDYGGNDKKVESWLKSQKPWHEHWQYEPAAPSYFHMVVFPLLPSPPPPLHFTPSGHLGWEETVCCKDSDFCF